MTSPTRVPAAVSALLVTVSPGAATLVGTTASVDVALTTAPVGGRPLTLAVLRTDPASTSACRTVYVAVPVAVCPGVRVFGEPGQVIDGALRPARVSVSVTPLSVTLPELRIVNANVTVLPTSPDPVVTEPVFCTAIDGTAAIRTVEGAVPVTAAPRGGVPVAVAVFATAPASTSVCVTV